MFDKLKDVLFLVSYSAVLCSVLYLAYMAYGWHIMASVPIILFAVAMIVFLWLKVKQCRNNGVPLSTQFMGNIFCDIMVMLSFVPAYAEDKQEEVWWPLLLMACVCCTIDFVRNLLSMFNGKREHVLYYGALSGYAASVPRITEKRTYDLKKGCSTRYVVMSALVKFVQWLLLMCAFAIVSGVDVDFVYDVVSYLAFWMVFFFLDISGTWFAIDGRMIETSKGYSVKLIDMHEIVDVKVENTFFGRCIKIFYGYGKQATSYPADIEDVMAWLKRRHVEVEIVD